MAQATQETRQASMVSDEATTTAAGGGGASGSFRFNVQAPEFVPRSHTPQTQMPVSGYVYPYFQFLGGCNGGSDWFYVGDQVPLNLVSRSNVGLPNFSKNVLTDDLKQKIIKQAEYQFSDMSLLANESLVKHMSKDPEGYVPLPVIANSKKIKSLVTNHHLLVQALRASSKLVVSTDGKKVKRKHSFADRDKEDLQARTVVVENLPEDHSHQNLEKIFNVVGRVKTIRICHPQESNSARSKGASLVISNKLHALVEYETSEIAEKAAEKLNDERNWRKGLRVRPLLRCSPKSVLKHRKSEFDGYLEDDDDDDDDPSEESSQPINPEPASAEIIGEETSTGSKKGWARGRGKAKVRTPNHGGRGLLAPSPQTSNSPQHESLSRQLSKGPRMPDGTRGFTMGRGKPITSPPTSPPTSP